MAGTITPRPHHRRLSDNIVEAHRAACERGNQILAHLLREAMVIEATSFGHGRTDRRHDAEPVIDALDRHRLTFEREAS